MQWINKYDKEIGFLLRVLIFSAYMHESFLLNRKKGIKITNTFLKNLYTSR